MCRDLFWVGESACCENERFELKILMQFHWVGSWRFFTEKRPEMDFCFPPIHHQWAYQEKTHGVSHDKLWHNPFSQVPINLKDNRHFSLRKSQASSKSGYWAPAYDPKRMPIWKPSLKLEKRLSAELYRRYIIYIHLLSLQFRPESVWSRIFIPSMAATLQASIINQVGESLAYGMVCWMLCRCEKRAEFAKSFWW